MKDTALLGIGMQNGFPSERPPLCTDGAAAAVPGAIAPSKEIIKGTESV